MKNIRKFFAALLVCLACSCACADEYVEGEVLAVFRSSGNVRASAEVIGASVADTYEALSREAGKIFVRVKSETKTTEELIAELKQMPDVISVSPNRIHRSPFNAVTPNDEHYDMQWGLERIKAPEAWAEITGSDNVYVAVIDSGVYPHPDLEANIAGDLGLSGWQNDIVGHGTHVAGVIGAVGNNGAGVAGVNWKVKIIPINVANTEGEVDDASVIDAVDYIAELITNQNINIAAVNMSFGGYEDLTPAQKIHTPYYEAFKTLDSLNKTLLVIAAGNEGLEVGVPAPFTYPELLMRINNKTVPEFYQGDYMYPAGFTGMNNMIVVGATDYYDKAPSFTNWGSRVDIAAPGDTIYSTYSPYVEDDEGNTGSYYSFLSGTSMAAPFVTGAAALLKAKYPNAAPSQIRTALISGADKNINPTVYPYQYQVDEISNIEELSYEQKQYIIEALGVYEQLDGGKVSGSGLLNIKAAMDTLSENAAIVTGNRDAVGLGGDASSDENCGLGLGSMALFALIALISHRKHI